MKEVEKFKHSQRLLQRIHSHHFKDTILASFDPTVDNGYQLYQSTFLLALVNKQCFLQ